MEAVFPLARLRDQPLKKVYHGAGGEANGFAVAREPGSRCRLVLWGDWDIIYLLAGDLFEV